MTTTETTAATVLDRIRAAARAAHDYKVNYDAELERRDAAIIEAYDTPGIQVFEIAHAAQLSAGRISRVVAAKDRGSEQPVPELEHAGGAEHTE